MTLTRDDVICCRDESVMIFNLLSCVVTCQRCRIFENAEDVRKHICQVFIDDEQWFRDAEWDVRNFQDFREKLVHYYLKRLFEAMICDLKPVTSLGQTVTDLCWSIDLMESKMETLPPLSQLIPTPRKDASKLKYAQNDHFILIG